MTDSGSHSLVDALDIPDASFGSAEETNPWSTHNDEHVDVSSHGEHPGIDSTLVIGATTHATTLALPSNPLEEVKPPDLSLSSEFDPLVSNVIEDEAQEAWTNVGSRPPLPAKDASDPVGSVTPPESPATPQKDATTTETPLQKIEVPVAQPPLASISSFSSLASLARTLTRSPRRSITPPPRSSSLRHSHHISVSSVPDIQTSPAGAQPNNAKPSSTSDAVATASRANTPSEGIVISGSPKPDGQFDFQKFLDQMKTKGADPIAKYLRSFLSNFAKKTFAVNDQIKIIHDFLDFISDKMRTMDGSPWQNTLPKDFDNAMEAMEKLVMNRLYDFTFQPLLSPSLRTTDDLERDHVLRQRISLFGWLREEHLDVPTAETNQGGREIKGFLEFAQQELIKINHYKAPRDKLICILNCCKVIFGLIRHVKLTEGADSFIPILIFVVLKANPEHLLSNVEYINRFRRPNKLQSEAGYYLSSLMGAISFIETMDHSSLSNITQKEFEENVEAAIEALPATRTPSPSLNSTINPILRTPRTPNTPGTPIPTPPKLRSSSSFAGEEAARPLSLPMPTSPADVPSDPMVGGQSNSSQLSIAEDTRRFFQRTSDTISKPLAAIGRIFSEVIDEGLGNPADRDRERRMGWRDLPGPFAPLSIGNGANQPSTPWVHTDPSQSSDFAQQQQQPHTPMRDVTYNQPPMQTPYKPRIRPAYTNSPSNSYLGSSPGPDFSPSTRGQPMLNQALALGSSQSYRHAPPPVPIRVPTQRDLQAPSPHPSRNPTPTLDFGALQDEIDRAHLAAQDAARATLMQIFPTVDREVAEMVLEANDGDLGRSIEGLLEISGGHAEVG